MKYTNPYTPKINVDLVGLRAEGEQKIETAFRLSHPVCRRVIGLSGRKRSGKDEACKALESQYKVYRVAFADPLKKELAEACEVTTQDIDTQKERFRLGMQWWGTEFRRSEDSNYWVDKAIRRVQAIQAENPGAVIVFTDVRFPNEADIIRSLGGQVWRVNRRVSPSLWGRVKKLFGFSKTDAHASEIALDNYPFDTVVENDGTLTQFHAAILNRFVKTSPEDERAE